MKKVNAAKLEMARLEELKAQGLDTGPPKPQVKLANTSYLYLPLFSLNCQIKQKIINILSTSKCIVPVDKYYINNILFSLPCLFLFKLFLRQSMK